MKNPWALSEAQAIAREDAIYDQFLAAVKAADRFANQEMAEAWLKYQFRNTAVREAIMASLLRRSAR